MAKFGMLEAVTNVFWCVFWSKTMPASTKNSLGSKLSKLVEYGWWTGWCPNTDCGFSGGLFASKRDSQLAAARAWGLKSKKLVLLSFLSTDNSGEYVLDGSGVWVASNDRSGWIGLAKGGGRLSLLLLMISLVLLSVLLVVVAVVVESLCLLVDEDEIGTWKFKNKTIIIIIFRV